MSAPFARMIVKAIAFSALACAVLGLARAADQTADDSASVPFSRVGLGIAGDTSASVAVSSKNPYLKAAGVIYKVADLAIDVGAADWGHALDQKDRWIGAEMILADEDAKRLKAIKATGGDLDGIEATAIKQGLRDRKFTMTSGEGLPVGYTDLGYAVQKVEKERLIKKAIEFALDKFGVFKLVEHYMPVPEKINWMLNYGGSLEEFEKGLGWGKLGTRARAAEMAASKTMEAVQVEIAKKIFGRDRAESARDLAATALKEIYNEVMEEHPSSPRTVQVASFRLEAAQTAALLPEVAAADPVVRAVQADDALGWQRYANPVPSARTTFNLSPPPTPVQTQQSAIPAWQVHLHQSLQNYSTNWDGAQKR